jgi:hypothetical protein
MIGSMMKRGLLSLAMICLFATAANAGSVVLYNNLPPTPDGADPVGMSFGPLADSFSTMGSAFLLDDVKLMLELTGPAVGSITVSLLADSSTSPGALLTTIGTLDDTAVGPTPAMYDFPISPFLLAASTRYWISLSADPTNDSNIYWTWSMDTSGVGVAGEYHSNASGVVLNGGTSDTAPYQMEVSGSLPVPEPTSLLPLGIGLAMVGGYAQARKQRRAVG